MKQTVCVLGEGAWGTAFATLLAHNGYTVNLWCHDKGRAVEIAKERYNTTYLPGIALSESIHPTHDMRKALSDVQWVFEAIPTQYIRSVLTQAQDWYKPSQVWIILSKGLEEGTIFLPSQIVADVFGNQVKTAVVAGPNFARELAEKKITAATLGISDCVTGTELQKLLANDYFRPYISLDPIGVEVGSALKNIIALAVGMLDGAGYGDNAKAFVLTRGLREMVRIATALGGKQETLYGLSGVGDLVLTAMGKASRNRDVGVRLGRGEPLSSITATAEGINATKAVCELAERYKLDIPVCAGLYRVIFGDVSVADWLAYLMKRPLEYENECAK